MMNNEKITACAACRYRDLCNGNTRIRAFHASGDYWGEDPGCYLSDAEIGLVDDDDWTAAGARDAAA